MLATAVGAGGQALTAGLLDNSRSPGGDWHTAGIPSAGTGNLPDASWTQCGSTIAPYSGTGQTINAALAACPNNTYVQLGTGTFNLTTLVEISVGYNYGLGGATRSNVALRGMGANNTKLVFANVTQSGLEGSIVTMYGSTGGVGYEDNQCTFGGASTTSTVTSGTYQSGATYVSVPSCSAGALSNLHVGGLIILDQTDPVGDNGGYYPCALTNGTSNTCAGANNGGFIRSDGPCSAAQTAAGVQCNRSQSLGFMVVSISGNVVQLDRPIPPAISFASANMPQAWFLSNQVSYIGLENLTVDQTNNAHGGNFGIMMNGCNYCWVSGVETVHANRSHIASIASGHDLITSNYAYRNQTGGSVSYGYEMSQAFGNVVENNIFHGVTDSSPNCNGPCAFNVVDMNYVVVTAYTLQQNLVMPAYYFHAGGDQYNLIENNNWSTPGVKADNIHGTHTLETIFRNSVLGWASQCNGISCVTQANGFSFNAGSRYFNLIGNVIGEPGFHTSYRCLAVTGGDNGSTAACTGGGYNNNIYTFGTTENTYAGLLYDWCTSAPPGSCTARSQNPDTYGRMGDPQSSPSMFLWGNYDVVTGAVRWCGNASNTGWSTTCSSTTEVSSLLAPWAGAVPTVGDTGAGDAPLPASLYYSSRPAWLPSGYAWPLIGPDVTGGTLGFCSGASVATYNGMPAISGTCGTGTLTTAWAGHANATPAMNCFLTSGGTPDGYLGATTSGSQSSPYVTNTNPLPAFNASTCYSAAITPPPTVVLNASPSNISSGSTSTLTWTTSGATSCTASGGTFTGSVALSGSQSVSPTTTTTYGLSCTGAGGTTASSAQVVVSSPPPPTPQLLGLTIVNGNFPAPTGYSINPTVAPTVLLFTGNHPSITTGSYVTLIWNIANAASATLNGAQVLTQGSMSVNPSTTTTYTLTGENIVGSTSSTFTITVTP